MSNQFDYNSTVSNAVNRGDGSGEIDIKPLVEPLAITLIVVGIVVFIIAFLGACGACCNSRVVLAAVSLQSTYCYYAAILIGHITCLARPSVPPFVCLSRTAQGRSITVVPIFR